jgi:tape measure domain-containing protein
MTSESVDVSVTSSIDPSVAKNLEAIGKSAGSAQRNLDHVNKALKDMHEPMSKIKEDIKSYAKGSDMLERAFKKQLRAILGSVKELDRFRESLKQAGNQQQQFRNTVSQTSPALMSFGNILKSFAGYFGIKTFAQTTSSLVDFKARLDDTAGSADAGTAAMKRLMSLAKGTYSSFEQTAESFLSNASALKELGYSTNQQLTYTEALNNAMVASAIKGEQAASEMYALNKAMMLGKLSGVELNTVMKNGGYIVEALANEFGGSSAKLLEAGRQGKITSDVLFNAITKNYDLFKTKADAMKNQIMDALTNLKTGIQEYVFESEAANAVSNALADGIMWLSQNIKSAAQALTILGGAYIACTAYNLLFARSVDALGQRTLPPAIAKVKAFTLALAANPIGFLIAALALATSAIVLFGDKIKLTTDGTVTLKDVCVDMFEKIKTVGSDAINWIESAWSSLSDSIKDGAKIAGVEWKVVIDNIISGTKKAANFIIGVVKAFFIVSEYVFKNTGAAWETLWVGMKNTSATILESILNSWQLVIKGLAHAISYVNEDMAKAMTKGLDKLTIKFDRSQVSEETKRVNEDVRNELQKALSADYISSMSEGWGNYIDDLAKRKKTLSNETVINDDGNAITAVTKKITQLTKEQQKLLDSLNPTRAAIKEYNQALNDLKSIYNAGAISAKEYSDYLTLLEEKFKESIDPLNYYIDDLQRQIDLMKLSSEQRTIENELYSATHDLMKKGIILSKAESEELRKKIALKEDELRLQSMRDSLQSSSIFNKNRNFNDFTTSLSALLNDKISNFTENDLINALNSDSNSPFAGMFDGTWELMQTQISQFETMYNQINLLTEQFGLSQETAAALRTQVWAQQQNIMLSHADNFFGQLAQLQNSNNAAMARVGKAAAISQAIINTYQSATSAYAAMAGIPYVGPALGAAAAAAAVAAGMANVSAIRSQSVGFMTGGYTGDMARTQVAGVVHGQEFVMNASATQRIGRDNLEALQNGSMSLQAPQQVVNNYSQSTQKEAANQNIAPIINIALVSDHESAEEWLSTQEGMKKIMEINREHSSELSAIVSSS